MKTEFTNTFRSSFEYSEESPHHWPELLRAEKQRGVECVISTVFWGAHESLPGVRDFTKASRLRLEKYLTILQDIGLKTELVLGFPPSTETFPDWALNTNRKILIPASLWDGLTEGCTLTQLPDIFDEMVKETFLSFVNEVLGIVGLYRAPEGPVVQAQLDFGIYEMDLSFTESPHYSRWLEARHHSIEKLNSRFQTNFKNFSAAASTQASRVLGDKRPWLAAYDYKWCREKMLKELRNEVEALSDAPGLLVSTLPVSVSDNSSSWEIVVDGVLVETPNRGGCYPFCPGGYSNHTSILAFRLVEFIQEQARAGGFPCTYLSVLGEAKELSRKNILVVCGKYLTLAAFLSLTQALENGANLYFPFGYPQYDEEMNCFDWHISQDRSLIGVGEEKWFKVQRGAGTLCFPPQPCLPSEDLSTTLSNLMGSEW